MSESHKSNNDDNDNTSHSDSVNNKQVEDVTDHVNSSPDCCQQQQQQQEQEVNHDQKQHEIDKKLLEPFYYINSVPGKNVRSLLIDCFQIWFQVNDSTILDLIKDIIGDLHNASLLIDDIEDNSRLRRGIPVAHAIFGIPPVLNCANYVYFIALNKCQQLHNPNAITIFSNELLNLHRGQGYDILWREMSTCPTEEQYINMVQDKTGGLFRLAVGLLQSFATYHTNSNFTSLVNNLGLYFQIRDDYINLVDDEYFRSKTFCEDITEGKFSYPIVHCINSNETNSIQLLSILKQRTEDIDVKKYAQRLMKDSGSLDYTRTKCHELKNNIINNINEFGGNPMLIDVINKLHIQLEKLDTTTENIDNNTNSNTITEQITSLSLTNQRQQQNNKQIDSP